MGSSALPMLGWCGWIKGFCNFRMHVAERRLECYLTLRLLNVTNGEALNIPLHNEHARFCSEGFMVTTSSARLADRLCSANYVESNDSQVNFPHQLKDTSSGLYQLLCAYKDDWLAIQISVSLGLKRQE